MYEPRRHFISSLLPRSVSLCVITSSELAEGPGSLLRSVLLLSLLWRWLQQRVCVCICMCVCVRVWPKPSLETAPKCWQCGVMPCLSHCLSHKYFWPLGSTLRLPLLAARSHHRTGDSGAGTQPSCLTSPSFLLSRGPLGY